MSAHINYRWFLSNYAICFDLDGLFNIVIHRFNLVIKNNSFQNSDKCMNHF